MDEQVIAGVTRLTIGRDVLAPSNLWGDERRPIALTQPGEARRLAEGLVHGAPIAILEVPDGEAAKSLMVVEEICRRLAEAGLDRRGRIVGIGGGALADLAGFVAGVYMRGVALTLVPTTLLAAVDAAIGGKSGVNAGSKNLVGLFRHPDRIVIDLEILERLPEALIREGAAEALKAGLVGDPALVALFEADGLGASLEEVVRRAVAVKVGVVDADFHEGGQRMILNYGHTVGHAVEHAAGLSHGAAVAVGMVAAGRASEIVLGFEGAEWQRSVIESLGLPSSAPSVGIEEVVGLIDRDKKWWGGEQRMVLLSGVGSPRVVDVDSATVRAALHEVGITR